MFRIAFICDDKKLAQILRGLQGQTYDLTVVPVANAEKANGKLKEQTPNGNATELFLHHIKKHRITEVTPRDVQNMLQENGFSARSYSYAMRSLQDKKILSKTKSARGTYAVLGSKKSKAKPATAKAAAT
jgi:hypothetical protein